MIRSSKSEVSNTARSSEVNAFQQVAPYYDTLMQGIPYIWWFHYVEALMDKLGRKADTVLDLCCGTGNLTQLFAINGYQSTGIDVSEPMIERAKQKALETDLPIYYEAQDASRFELDRRFDLVVSLFDSLNNLTDPDALANCFRQVKAHLNPEGTFIFDLNTEYAFTQKMFDQKDRKPSSPIRYLWTSRYDKKSKLCQITMNFWVTEDGEEKQFVEIHQQRAYSETEIQGMLQRAGFTRCQTFNAYTLKPPTRRSDRVFYAAY